MADKKEETTPLEPFFDRDRDLQTIRIDPKKYEPLFFLFAIFASKFESPFKMNLGETNSFETHSF
jgi:hypothetical protein